MNLRITWWEYEELIDHLSSRNDIWTQSDENEFLWLRSAFRSDPSSGEEVLFSACALHFIPPSSLSPYRQYGLQSIPVEWEEAYVDAYLLRTLKHWTGYAEREAVASLLRTLGIADADLVAIAIKSLDWIDGEAVPVPARDPEDDAAARIWPDTLAPLTSPPDPLDIGTFLLHGGAGWIKLRLQSDMIRIAVSLRSRETGGFGAPLEGFVRPKCGRVRDVAAFLAGWSATSEGALELPEPQNSFLETLGDA